MDRQQIGILKDFGFMVEEMPSVHRCPRATFYRRRETGEIEAMPNLPIDPYSLRRYLSKGFVLDPKDLKPQTKEGEFVCTVCGKACKSAFGLQAHSRVHKK